MLQCHEDHAAVEHTFVQFYPTLKQVAKKIWDLSRCGGKCFAGQVKRAVVNGFLIRSSWIAV